MIFATLLGAALGATLGSFGGVVATRTRRGESIVHPASACDSCRSPLRAYDNVPIVSWLALRGRCRACLAAIPLFLFWFEVFGASVGAGLTHVFVLANS